MAKSKDKTNVMRILDSKNVEYKFYSYEADATLTGIDVAHKLNKDENTVFKTLVTVGKSKEHYVFVIPVNRELDLKKASKSVSEKNISMVKSRDLLALTGYIHGGCSPIGMKKLFKIVFHDTVNELDTITFSAGKIGYQVELTTQDLPKAIDFSMANICAEE